MSIILNRDFQVSAPSRSSLGRLFEFDCTIHIHDTQETVVDIKEDTIGSVQLKTRYSGEVWRLFVFVWHECHMLALRQTIVECERDSVQSKALCFE